MQKLSDLKELPTGYIRNKEYLRIENIVIENIIIDFPGHVTVENTCTFDVNVIFETSMSVDIQVETPIKSGTIFRNINTVWFDYLETLPEGITFHNINHLIFYELKHLPSDFVGSGQVVLYGMSEVTDAGIYGRNLVAVNCEDGDARIALGCFWGTKKEAIKAIKKKYGFSNKYRRSYIRKVKQAFEINRLLRPVKQ